jgi:hypothetical protein
MYSETCLICNENFNNEFKSTCRKHLYSHIKNKHSLSKESYIISYKYNGSIPTCACGCGNKTRLVKGKYIKYYKDHKNKTKPSEETILKGLETKNNNYNIEKILNDLLLDKETLKKYYDEFVNFKIPLKKISVILGLDKRTIKKYWKELKFIENKVIFERICRKHQSLWIDDNNIYNHEDYDKVIENLPLIYNFLLENNNEDKKFTLGNVINYFDLKCSSKFLYETLIKFYDEKYINKLLRFHNMSQIEMEFYNILKFYFNKKVEKQFPLEDRIYDFKIGNKLLIEFDGDYWHSTEEAIKNDKYKDELAHRNNYIIFRVKEKNCKNLNILIKIQKLDEKFNKI